MSIRYSDRSMNDHQHATPRRDTVKEMMDFRNYQAFDVALIRNGLNKRFAGMIIRNLDGITVLTVTDPDNPTLHSTVEVGPAITSNKVFDAAERLANGIVDNQLHDFYRGMGFKIR